MHARVSTIYGTAEGGEEGTRNFRDRVLPTLKDVPGCQGAILMVDRSSGKAVAVTLWESEQALADSEEAADRLRREASESAGATEPPTVDRYEVAVWEVNA